VVIQKKTLGLQFKTVCKDDDGYATQLKGKGSPYSIAERSGADPGSWQSACSDVSHKPGGRLQLLSTRPAVTIATLKSLIGLPISLLDERRHDGCEQFA